MKRYHEQNEMSNHSENACITYKQQKAQSQNTKELKKKKKPLKKQQGKDRQCSRKVTKRLEGAIHKRRRRKVMS